MRGDFVGSLARASRVGAVALLALAGIVGNAAASTGCQLLNGASGTLAPGGTVFFNPSQAMNLNIGDQVTLSVSGTSNADLVYLMLGAETLNLFTNGVPQQKSITLQTGVIGGPSTLYLWSGNTNATGTTQYQVTCVSQAPSVTAASPVVGLAGDTVQIDGAAFLGMTAVRFGTTAASYTLSSDTRLTAVVPAGSGTVPLTVTTDAGTVSAGSFTYATVPGAPSIGTVTAGDAQAVVAFAPPASDGGASITTYTVTASPGGATASGPAGPLTVTGLSNGTAYTFSVTATNLAGTGLASAASASVTPQQAQSISFSPPASVPFGQAVSLTASATSGLGVQFSTTTPAVCGVTGAGVLTPLTLGTCVVHADQGGDAAHTPAAQVSRSISIVSANGALALTTTGLPSATEAEAYDQQVSASGGDAPYVFAITTGTLPEGVVMSAAGRLSGTPTRTGNFPITVRVTDAAGQTATQALVLQVAAPAQPPPQARDDAASTLSNQPVTLAVTGNDEGVFTSIAISSAPAHGSATVSGLGVIYTPATDYAGEDALQYVVTGPGGSSAPATVRISVQARPVAAVLSTTAVAGGTVTVDLTAQASGGPFTAATLLSVSPANAGTATLSGNAQDGYRLAFVAATASGGLVQIAYTLTNAYATSAPGTLSISITPRSDPSKDAEVLGLLNAQAESARRLASGQMGNFQRRLEALRAGRASGFSNGITLASASAQHAGNGSDEDLWNRRYLVQPDDAPAAVTVPEAANHRLPGDLAIWTGGAINFGDQRPNGRDSAIDFTTTGVSIGVDRAFGERVTLGVGAGYGHDDSGIGQHDSRSQTDAYNVAVYASYQPGDRFYVEGLAGYQWLRFDTRRYVTDTAALVDGRRDGTQIFASVSAGYPYRSDSLLLTPYGRLDVARASLDAYSESGDASHALDYRGQTVDTSTASLGLLAQWTLRRGAGLWQPMLRAEFGRDLQGDSQATMRYLDTLDGPFYQATLEGRSRSHGTLGAGLSWQAAGWLLRAEYQNYLDSTSGDNQSVQLGVEKRFGSP
ncbi:autotransporter domain-containing protein [Stenotrophomonas panacihumi]|nr:autotransporter domain-containing protein [Stenotrophomonas panacihumi]